MDETLKEKAAELLTRFRAANLKIVTAESCTGGLVSACLTEVPGSSDVVERGFVTYSNTAKSEMLGVPVSLIASQGAVSDGVARSMAEGALTHSHADISVAVTGIAGPGGGTAEKPVGLVFVAVAREGSPTLCNRFEFGEITRDQIRHMSVLEAFRLAGSIAGVTF